MAMQAWRLPYLTDVQVGLETWAHLDHFLEVRLGAGQVVPVRHASEPHLDPLQVMEVGSDVDLSRESAQGRCSKQEASTLNEANLFLNSNPGRFCGVAENP